MRDGESDQKFTRTARSAGTRVTARPRRPAAPGRHGKWRVYSAAASNVVRHSGLST
ncbi:hypothetical protein GCM10023235_06240 [Kitasatospora terrestris]|uniref:Transposase n=1 Tax=Kitasatospora terrestris TaxID=258051 RepID=A0ABP9DD74_9ACTN